MDSSINYRYRPGDYVEVVNPVTKRYEKYNTRRILQYPARVVP